MMEWWRLIGNGAWIVGLALLLAAFSFGRYATRLVRAGIWTRNRSDKTVTVYRLGGLFITVGLLIVSDIWWQRIGWSLVALLLLWEVVIERFTRGRPKGGRHKSWGHGGVA